MVEDKRYADDEMARLAKQGIRPTTCEHPDRHSYDVRNIPFTIDSRYRILNVLGMGAYGLVVSAVDDKSGEKVAIKRINNLFESIGDGKRILREIRLMRVLQCEQILGITDMEVPVDPDTFNEIYIVSPLFNKDLERILRAKVELSDVHVQYFVYQMLCGLKYMHSASIVHRDLKPANILVQESCDLVLCDLGLARYIYQSEERKDTALTEYVVTRWYRAPELVLCGDAYGLEVDMWAVGCILAELLLGNVLFPGRDFRHQVELICSIIGKPAESDCKHIESAQARAFVEGLADEAKHPLRKMFSEKTNPDAIDLIEKLLIFDPAKRMTAVEALEHPYLADYHEPENEIVAPDTNYSWLEPRNEDGSELTVDQLRKLMLKEISHFRSDDKLFKERPELKWACILNNGAGLELRFGKGFFHSRNRFIWASIWSHLIFGTLEFFLSI